MKEIKLSQGKIARVDDDDYEILKSFTWHIHNKKYAATCFYIKETKGTKSLFMHRMIMNPMDGVQVDHIDHDGLNNQRSNLRLCSNSQNSKNVGKRKNTSSKYLGVSYTINRGHKYIVAQIMCDYKKIKIGQFKSEEDAAKAYDKKAIELFGDYANINFK